jgi:polysaccharide biosynthesis/export protein
MITRPATSKTRCHGVVVLVVGLAAMLMGCHAINLNPQAFETPVPPDLAPPRELSMVSLPAYRIEPPDVLRIEVVKLVPRPPYRVENFDVLQIRANTPPDQPIENFLTVEAEGTINFGSPYGSVRVAGMTIDEVRVTLNTWLRQWLRDPSVSVQLAQMARTQQVTGTYDVQLDGTVNLRGYGHVHLAGKTLVEAKIALEKHLAQFFDSPEVFVDVAANRSKGYYVIVQSIFGDTVYGPHNQPTASNETVRQPFMITGNDTVLDAICEIRGLSQMSTKKIWVARPAPTGGGCEQILPVDWAAITQGAVTDTNYQLMPGDRVYIAEDELMTFSALIGKVTAPIERTAGIMSLGSSTIGGFQTMGRNYNRTRNGL